MNLLRPVVMIAMLFALAGCGERMRLVEVARSPTVDGTLDAVLTESASRDGDDTAYNVHVVRTGGAVSGDPVARLVGARRGAAAFGVNLAWTSPRVLEVRYLDATEARIDPSAVRDAGAGVEVSLVPGIVDADAPRGVMRAAAGAQASR
ncbi:hypothetical protein ACQQ2N_16575 [Dokdonella sp. MW10]|uniref:hypothetical protein n=1 Tax=Dokdonella sp. MW10 TaxID=2992926 RepID=UPI003F7DF144